MKTVIAIIVLLLATVGPSNGQTPEHSARIKHLLQRYDDYAQVKPVLVNEGSRSMFLDPLNPGMAAVHRFDRTTRKWWVWGGLSECGLGDKDQVVEIKPGDEYTVFVNWGSSLLENPPPGSYKLQVRYSLEPWSLDQPEKIYVAESGEFRMTKSKPPRRIPGRKKEAIRR